MHLRRRIILAVSTWVALSFTLGQGGQDPTPSPERKGEFVKDRQICADCHDEEDEDIAAGFHARVPDQKGLKACETCHGPGEKHVQSEDASRITHPARLTAKAQRKLCATCHAAQLEDHGGPLDALFAAGKKCSTCHRIHEPKDIVPGSQDPHHFRSQAEAAKYAKNVGLEACADCHGDKEANLVNGVHKNLITEANKKKESCETCHGPGSLHVESLGIRRLITRPDEARDGAETCRSCHEEVDPVDFHWDRKHWPLLGAPKGAQLTCTTCHQVHGASHQAEVEDSQLRPGACLGCHSPAYEVLQGRVHESLSRWDQGLGRGCVSCHPGAAKHVHSGGRPEFVTSPRTQTEQKAICSSCHGKQDKVCGYVFGIHGRKGVACLDCHGSAPLNTPKARAQDANSGCATCHKRAAASFRGPNRGHPVGENKFTCASCHEAHKQKGVTLVSAWKTQFTCTGCHKEYQGPFLFEHNAKRGEGCLSCHVAHNNSHPKLLPARRTRDNCLPCHADLPAFHDQGPGSVYRNCLHCHVQIHGSNRNRYFFR